LILIEEVSNFLLKTSGFAVANTHKMFNTGKPVRPIKSNGGFLFMKKMIVLGLGAVSLSLLSSMAMATNDYPAADFQPKVVYIDEDAVGKTASASQQQTAYDPDYPAASFQPKVVYIDKDAAKKAAPVIKFDPNYPAAYFQPKVIYP
jgi:hypothetical protein